MTLVSCRQWLRACCGWCRRGEGRFVRAVAAAILSYCLLFGDDRVKVKRGTAIFVAPMSLVALLRVRTLKLPSTNQPPNVHSGFRARVMCVACTTIYRWGEREDLAARYFEAAMPQRRRGGSVSTASARPSFAHGQGDDCVTAFFLFMMRLCLAFGTVGISVAFNDFLLQDMFPHGHGWIAGSFMCGYNTMVSGASFCAVYPSCNCVPLAGLVDDGDRTW